MAGPAILAAPYVTPAVVQGLGALGTGLAALGIIENKDAIKDFAVDTGRRIKRNAGQMITDLSMAMSPDTPTANPNIDYRTGRYVAAPDVVQVMGIPSTVGRYWGIQDGELETPEEYNAVQAVINKTKEAQQSQSTQAPKDPKENNDSTKVTDKIKKFLWETKKNSPKSTKAGRYARNYVFRLPAYTGLGTAGIDVVGNIAAAADEDPNVKHEWKWKTTKGRFTFERGGFKLFRDAYKTNPTYDPTYKETDASVETKPAAPADTFVVVPTANKNRQQGNGLTWNR